MAPVLKTGIPEMVSGVRIPPSPPALYFLLLTVRDYQLTTKFQSFCFRRGNKNKNWRQDGSHTLSPGRQRQLPALSEGQSGQGTPPRRPRRSVLPAVLAG